MTDEYHLRDIQVLKTYGAAPYAASLKKLEKQIKEKQTSVNEKIGVKVGTSTPVVRLRLTSPQESDTGLAPPHLWDIPADRQRMSEDHPLQVARCTKIIQDEENADKSKYVINVKQIAKFVVKLGERVAPTDIEEGMRVGYVSYCLLTPSDSWSLNLAMLTPSFTRLELTGTNMKFSSHCPPKSTPL